MDHQTLLLPSLGSFVAERTVFVDTKTETYENVLTLEVLRRWFIYHCFSTKSAPELAAASP